MPAGLKRFLVFVVCVLVAWYAHLPLLGAGFLGSDAAVLAEVDRAQDEHGLRAFWSVEAVDHRPMAAASLALSRKLHSRDGVYTPGDAGRLRLESLVLLVVAAFGVRAAVIRALRPWTGEDHARAAGAAAGTFLMLHPLLVPVVAHLPQRGDVVALAASAWSTALLLKGRQDRRAVAFAMAFVLALVAASASRAALLLVPLGFGLEFFAARRHRPLAARVRTGAQVALGYGAALLIEFAVRLALRPGGIPSALEAEGYDPAAVLFATSGGLARALGTAAETTGVVVLPVNTTGLGTLGYVPAVIALLAALHPGFVAARAAPRLWGRVLGGWAIAIAVLLVLSTGGERTKPAELADAPGTMPLALTMAIGLGISATALSGGRRAFLPALAGGLYAILTAGSAATVQWATAEVGEVHDAVLAAAEEDDWRRGATWILDPPRKLFGIEALVPRDDSELTAGPFLPPGAEPVIVRGVPARSFWALSSGPEFEAARAQGLTLLVPRTTGSAPAREVELVIVRVDPRRGPRLDSFGWIGEGSSPAGRTIDPFDMRAIVAVAPPDVQPEDLVGTRPTLSWTGTRVDTRTTTGVWVDGPRGPEARFSLGREAAWLFAGEIGSLWFSDVLDKATSVQVSGGPAPFPPSVEPRVVGDDWTFDIAAVPLVRPIDRGTIESWTLWVIDPVSGRSAELAPTGAATGRLVAAGAARLDAVDVLWILDRALDGVVVQRARGLREARPELAPSPGETRDFGGDSR